MPPLPDAFLDAFQHQPRPADDVVNRKAGAFEQLGGWRRGAEAIERKHVTAVAKVASPTLHAAKLNGEPSLDGGWKYRVAVVRWLSVEELPTGHGNAADGKTFLT